MTAKDTVLAAVSDLFGKKDPSGVDRWVSADYRQHSSLAADGPEGMRQLIASLPDGFRYDNVRAIADGDMVALHGIYHGLGPEPLVAFDLFRVADGKLAEHWDALAPVVSPTASGRSQTDGPVGSSDQNQTEASRDAVTTYAEKILVGGDYSTAMTNYVSETYHQHNTETADGLDGAGAAAKALAEQGTNIVYTKIHKIIAEGDLVVLLSEGEFGVPVAFYDLYRVADSKIVEHWDIIAPIPASLPHDNGLF
ncbi:MULTISPECIES: nuclear transport factor 2 family protein [unclassified Streptomyces]|uniref:nuclear transport factor 2 family protein n=1 Tax=unclassified Streptomyces TaxID=2593676 RepID=UPI0036645098